MRHAQVLLSVHRKTVIRLSLGLVLLAALAAGYWRSDLDQAASEAQVPSCLLPPELPAATHAGMVWVPPGRFEMGDDRYPEEGPIHTTRVAGFWMDRTEVTNAQFAEFVQATGYVSQAERPVDATPYPNLPAFMRQPGAVVFSQPSQVKDRGDLSQWWRYTPGAQWRHPGGTSTHIQGRGQFPVVTVTYEDALAFARWKGRSLPSEAQWEWAARAGQALAAKDHDQPHGANTWQGVFPVLNSADDGFVGLAPVGCYAPNALGLFDMLGNVWELTRDVYTAHHRPVSDSVKPLDPDASGVRNPQMQQRVIKGGSFLCSPDYCMRYRSGSRQPQEEDLGTSHLGFRTVLEATGP
jgi:formylglycine-generating enzyme required for sulfatase activity